MVALLLVGVRTKNNSCLFCVVCALLCGCYLAPGTAEYIAALLFVSVQIKCIGQSLFWSFGCTGPWFECHHLAPDTWISSGLDRCYKEAPNCRMPRFGGFLGEVYCPDGLGRPNPSIEP